MKIFLLLILLLAPLVAKKDFYYSYIDDNKKQLAPNKKEKIIAGNSKLKAINQLVRDNRIEDALEAIVPFKESNKIPLLSSALEILHAEILLKTGTKKNITEGAKNLEDAINRSIIHESDTVEATVLLVKLFVKINKIKEAKFYVNSITSTFKDPLALAYGKIAESYIETQAKRYKNAIKILYDILLNTNNLQVATIVADELYDLYILNKQNDKAYELATKVLERNIDFYAKDSYMALIKVEKLIKANMADLAIQILEKLLENAKTKEHSDTFKYHLGEAYMSMNKRGVDHLLKAKEYYKDLVSKKGGSKFIDQAKIALDEILLREEKITPSIILKKYATDDTMQDKAMLQELLTFAKKHDYAAVAKFKNIYKNIKISTANRFGYKDIKEVFTIIDGEMIRYYLENNKCNEINTYLSGLDSFLIKKIINESNETIGVLECLLEDPKKELFDPINTALKDSRNGKAYILLERIAYMLGDYQSGFENTKRIDMLANNAIKSEEFLDRFLTFGAMNNAFSMEKFFAYARGNPNFIKENTDNPLIIDFYYQYYLYLLGQKRTTDAQQILNRLYATQNRMRAFVYSPYVEMQLASESVLDDKYREALRYLEAAQRNPRRIKPNDQVKLYYEFSKVYKRLKMENRYLDAIDKCKKVEGADSIYKSMCDKL